LVGIRNRREIDEPNASAAAVKQVRRNLKSETGLSAPPSPGERDEPRRADEVANVRELARSTHKFA